MKGVLDRFEGNQAVILIEEEKAELILPKEDLPVGSDVNTVFQVEKDENDNYKIIEIDHKAEQEAKETTQDLLAKLRAKSSGSKFKKK
ncbi:DUF3006 domain-containing protein [Ornithinibacillus halotolerans]|uniref:DUF3006 domain-containing protein n=1 Tax=Ornithinibacillus halotolerans TaxID=1274357 RepID=A0A916W429_9BACI|nr:DUF3006 domain-containing protein [Ornithinibacillus halotolerans]GGA65741.1 hypothetical protein GCM10008025_06920 [Ornithinibacillus halotolerans]